MSGKTADGFELRSGQFVWVNATGESRPRLVWARVFFVEQL